MTTAAAITRSVTAGETTAGDVARRHLEAAGAAAGINAFISLPEDAVMRRAEEIDRRPTGPLAGVPVALKDLIDQAGAVTTAGSSFYRHHPDRSAPVVDRLEAAGAIIFGRANLHEFAFGFSSENPWWGAVRNPWDLETSAGGSSGGSAAAVAAGLAPVAIGTDTGGSVRVPAALCGVVGLKVTHGRVPLRGVFPLVESLDTVGPLAQTVADATAVYRVIAGWDPEDPWSAPAPPRRSASISGIAGLRIGIPEPLVGRPLDAVTDAGFRWALDRMADAGAVVERVSIPGFHPTPEMLAIIGVEAAAVHGDWFGDAPTRYGDDVQRRIADAMAVGVRDLVAARRWQASIRHAVAGIFQRFDFLATPTVAVHRKEIGADEVETTAGPEPYRRALSWFTAPVNQVGCPALALPLAAAGSPPPSLQLIAPRWDEDRLLEMGIALEAAGIVAYRTAGSSDGER